MKSLRQKAYDLLRWSERFFKTDMVYLAKGGFWLTANQVFSAISAFALSLVFARLFPKDAYGTYKYILALSGVIGTLTLTGLGPAITQSVARGYDAALRKGAAIVFKWSIIIVAVSLGMAGYYLAHGNRLLAFALILIGLFSPIIDATSYFGSYLSGKKDFKTLSILNIFNNVIPALSLIVTLLITTNIWAIVLVYFVASATAMTASYLYTLKRFSPHGEEDPEMLPYAKHLTLITILNMLADQADKIIVYHYVGAVELAVYVFATALPTQIKGVLKGVYPLSLPKFANQPLGSIKKNAPQKIFKFSLIIFPIVVVYVLAAPYLYKIFFPQYTDAVQMSQVFSLSLLAYVSIIPSTILQAKKTIESLYGSNIAVALIKLALLFLGVKVAGVWGVVYARIAYEYVAFVVLWWFMMRSREPEPGVAR